MEDRKRHKLEELGTVSQFIVKGQYKYKETKAPARCQIEGCEKEAEWIQNLTNPDHAIFVCWNHHEERSAQK